MTTLKTCSKKYLKCVFRNLQECTNAIVGGWETCHNITAIMESAWQNMDYANYIAEVTSFHPGDCMTGKCSCISSP